MAAELYEADLTTVDLEPSRELCLAVQGMAIVCPMVAGNQLLGCLHIILPSNLANDYLYTRIPMTLAHQMAVAFLATVFVKHQAAVRFDRMSIEHWRS